jgi:hypothetical protein
MNDLVVMPNWYFEDRGYQADLAWEVDQQYAKDLRLALEQGEGVSHISVRADTINMKWDMRLCLERGGSLALETDGKGMGLFCRAIQLLDVDEFSIRRYEVTRKNESAVRMKLTRALAKYRMLKSE